MVETELPIIGTVEVAVVAPALLAVMASVQIVVQVLVHPVAVLAVQACHQALQVLV
jgi:hypothetical protein